MALVSYGYSDSEEISEDEDDGSQNVIISQACINENDKEQSEVYGKADDNEKLNSNITEPVSTGSIFSQLPKSQTTSSKISENEIEDFIPKAQIQAKPKHKVKITIPALSEFQEEDDDGDEPAQKKHKPSAKCSGLLSLLPPVKSMPLSNKSFVPQSVSLKNKPASQKSVPNKMLVPNVVKKNQINATSVATKAKAERNPRSEIESDDEDIELPETFDDEMWQKVCGRQKPKEIHREKSIEAASDPINIAPEPEKPYSGLDNAAFKELVGRKRKEENINVIDINEDEILPEKDLWMTKSLTDPECAPKKVIENPVDPTRRRKHHITYLAEQAKANEQELQNQWSANKFSRNQSRAKYGF